MEDSEHAEDKPWLALPRHNREKGCSMRFQSVTSNNVYDYELAACASGKTLCGSSSGFLIMVDETSQISTIDLLTKARRFTLPTILPSLPPKPSTDIEPSERRLTHKYPVHKAVLSSPPDRNPYDYILMVIHGEERELAYYSALTQTWIEIQEAGRYYDDIIFRLGKFYAVDKYGKVILCEPGSKVYLVVMAIRFLMENPNVGYETYKFDASVGDMGDWAILLGQNESMALSIRVVKGAKGNCIYFTDDNFDAYKYGVVGGHDIGIYDTGEERSKPLQCCQSDIQCAWPRPINMRKRQDIHSRSPVRILETTSIPQLLGEDRGLVHGIQLAGSGH
ncbi:hypothetical protein ES288_D05G200900v1 [Gossypium darwinii]|uniref:KIB1-4 beta-propeller domain-containing protein n=1 Tax=Gossypium darwinii TaxID=34276 RepID=A0A5D2CI57_GOSDA|nr:hypothetical protein ES288_D05G200900v1 [Gossypium darwinii]